MSDTMTSMRARWINTRVAWNRRSNEGTTRRTGTVVDMTPAELLVEDHETGAATWITPDADGFEVLEDRPLDVADYTDDGTAKATFAGNGRGTGIAVDQHANGVLVTAFDNNTGRQIDVALSFGTALGLAVWLRDRLENHDYSAR